MKKQLFIISLFFTLMPVAATAHNKEQEQSASILEKNSSHFVCNTPPSEVLLKHIHRTSRDSYYLKIDSNKSEYKCQDFIGGEQENHYLILAFAGDKYSIRADESPQI